MRARPPALLVPLAASLLAAAPLAAQGSAGRVGMHIGYSRSALATPATPPPGAVLQDRVGTLLGVFLAFDLAGPLGLQPEIGFSSKGGEVRLGDVDRSAPSPTARARFEFAYLELPLLLTFSPSLANGHLRPRLFGGPAVAFRVGCDRELQVDTLRLRAACTEPLAGSAAIPLKGAEVEAIAGAGLEVRLRTTTLRLEARLHRGLTSIVDQDAPVRNRLWAVMVGFAF